MSHWWYRNIIEPGKLPLLLALGSFVVCFLLTRTVTRMIRADKGPFRNVSSGGTHVHHVVPGIVLMTAGGFGAVSSASHGVAAGISAVVFGVGAGLVLDEFALVLYMSDVYWSEHGRRSVEMVVITVALVGMLLAGFLPFGVNSVGTSEGQGRGAVAATIAVNFLLSLAALLKGKPRMAVLGVFMPFLALAAAVRLARPGSFWEERLYRRRPRTRRRAVKRAARHDARWAGPQRKLQDLLGGMPDR
jgi:hypothetical protein